jgi:hypothetical protein
MAKYLIALSLCIVFAASGCKKSGVGRRDIWGTVTWKGAPVKAGIIYFDPDVKKNNRGPQGFCIIKDGMYDTRFEKSKGCVAGPHFALIDACDGRVGPERPYGKKFFSVLPQVPIEIPEEGGEINLVIPDDVKATATDPQF